jgi:hypothetical protein
MAKWFHDRDGILTVSWHLVNPITSQWPGIKEPNGAGSAWEVDMLSADGLNAVRSVLPGGPNHAMFNSWLDRLARFFLSWRDDEGKLFALSECGPLSLDLQKILPDYKCSYVLTWRNAMPRHPRPGFQPKPDKLLKAMKADRHYLFYEDIKGIR